MELLDDISNQFKYIEVGKKSIEEVLLLFIFTSVHYDLNRSSHKAQLATVNNGHGLPAPSTDIRLLPGGAVSAPCMLIVTDGWLLLSYCFIVGDRGVHGGTRHSKILPIKYCLPLWLLRSPKPTPLPVVSSVDL